MLKMVKKNWKQNPLVNGETAARPYLTPNDLETGAKVHNENQVPLHTVPRKASRFCEKLYLLCFCFFYFIICSTVFYSSFSLDCYQTDSQSFQSLLHRPIRTRMNERTNVQPQWRRWTNWGHCFPPGVHKGGRRRWTTTVEPWGLT